MDKVIERYIQTGIEELIYVNSRGRDYGKKICCNGTSIRVFDKDNRKMAFSDGIGEKLENDLYNSILQYDRDVILKNKKSSEMERVQIIGFHEYIYEIEQIKKICSMLNVEYSIFIRKKRVNKNINSNINININKKELYTIVEIKLFFCDRIHKIIENIDNYERAIENIYYKVSRLKKLQKIKPLENKNIEIRNIILDSGQPSLIFHECCGHMLECKKGTQLNIELQKGKYYKKLNIIDDDFSEFKNDIYDDEGIKKDRIELIKNGCVTAFLGSIDTMIKNRNKELLTIGNARRESFAFYPEARMFSTYVVNQDDNHKDFVNVVEDALYVLEFGEAYVNCTTGEYVCEVVYGLQIEKGNIKGYVSGISIVGSAYKFLSSITGVGSDLKKEVGFCRSNSGFINIEFGGPTILVSNVNVIVK